jgi:hypothetical protein
VTDNSINLRYIIKTFTKKARRMSYNQCRICGDPAWLDPATQKFSPGCGKTHAKQAIKQGFTGPQAVQGQPLCQMCNSPAWFDPATQKFSPGCGKTHAQQAVKQGHTEPR